MGTELNADGPAKLSPSTPTGWVAVQNKVPRRGGLLRTLSTWGKWPNPGKPPPGPIPTDVPVALSVQVNCTDWAESGLATARPEMKNSPVLLSLVVSYGTPKLAEGRVTGTEPW